MTDLRTVERESIRAFVQRAADHGYLSGRVLDYGCGKQPYRHIVEAAGGHYYPFDREEYPANVSGIDVGNQDHFGGHRFADAVLCTQVLQYVSMDALIGDDVAVGLLESLAYVLGRYRVDNTKHGHLILTYPTNWPEVEPEDLHRFTKAGMERLLTEAGFEIVVHERRAEVEVADPLLSSRFGDLFALGYGVIARA